MIKKEKLLQVKMILTFVTITLKQDCTQKIHFSL